MMKWEIKEFYEENKSYCIATLVVMVIALAGAWLVHDYARNEPVYQNTNSTVADLNKRISDLEQRIATMQSRLAETQKTVDTIGRRISTSTGLAVEINEGLGAAEQRLDAAIQRGQRIENLIREIEAGN